MSEYPNKNNLPLPQLVKALIKESVLDYRINLGIISLILFQKCTRTGTDG